MAAFVVRLLAPEPYATPFRVVFYTAFAAGLISMIVERFRGSNGQKTPRA